VHVLLAQPKLAVPSDHPIISACSIALRTQCAAHRTTNTQLLARPRCVLRWLPLALGGVLTQKKPDPRQTPRNRHRATDNIQQTPCSRPHAMDNRQGCAAPALPPEPQLIVARECAGKERPGVNERDLGQLRNRFWRRAVLWRNDAARPMTIAMRIPMLTMAVGG
jgi:hypothetical protein